MTVTALAVMIDLYVCKVSGFVCKKASHIVVSIALAQYKQDCTFQHTAKLHSQCVCFTLQATAFNETTTFILMS